MGTAWREVERERRDAEQSGGRIFAIVVIAGLAFLAGRHLFKAEEPAATDPDAGVVASPPPLSGPREIEVPRSEDPSGGYTEAPSTSAPTGGRVVGVYQCVVGGQLVLSDRPCGADTRVRDVIVDDPDAQDAAAARQRWATQSNRPASRPASPGGSSVTMQRGAPSASNGPPDNSAQCASIDQWIESINARMRQGYTSDEGERLRAEWHAAKEQRQALKCGR